MDERQKREVGLIRKFNRYYTNILGLLDQHFLESDLSLSEVRVLHEIDKAECCTSKLLSEILCMDPGYLSRMLKKFQKQGLLTKTRSAQDGRAQYLALTAEGQRKMDGLNDSSDEQISRLIQPLDQARRDALVKDMTELETILTGGANIRREEVALRTQPQPGDRGRIAALHGRLYREEYGYSDVFEAHVGQSLYESLLRYDPQGDRLWCAEHHGNLVGCIGLVGHGSYAKLHWFVLDPRYRGIGLGRRMLEDALTFARDKGYERICLETTSDLQKAIGMYKRSGFVITGERPNDAWRAGLKAVALELKL